MSSPTAQWRAVTLGEVCELRYGRALPAPLRVSGEVRVYGSNGVVGQHVEALSEGPTIIVGRKGSFGEVHYSDASCWPIDTTFYADGRSTGADLRWLYHRLKGMPLNTLNRAAAVPGLSREDAYNQVLALPPLDEQRRIAEVLDRADALRAKRRQSIALLDDLTQSTFEQLFGDPAMRGPWPRVQIGDVAVRVQIGPFGSLLHESDYLVGGIALVNPMHIVDGEIKADPRHAVASGLRDSLRLYVLEEGDVILGRRGEMGRCAVVTEDSSGSLCGTGSLFIRPEKSLVSSDFLAAVLRHGSSRRRLEGAAQGVTMPNLNKRTIEQLDIPLPPIDLQLEYQRRLERLAVLRLKFERASMVFDNLFASLQERTFSGDL